jgi:transcriptional regulator with PAS, ATPase and Fis domain
MQLSSQQQNQTTSIQQMEIAMIKQALSSNKGNKNKAANQLGIDKSTLFRKLKAYKIQA